MGKAIIQNNKLGREKNSSWDIYPKIPTKLSDSQSKCRISRKSPKYKKGLFNPSPTISTFSGGLHLCTSCEMYSYFYTNAIFEENQEKLETNFLCRNKGLILL